MDLLGGFPFANYDRLSHFEASGALHSQQSVAHFGVSDQKAPNSLLRPCGATLIFMNILIPDGDTADVRAALAIIPIDNSIAAVEGITSCFAGFNCCLVGP
jgi:hypothetical protein